MLSAAFPRVGIGLLGVALAFGVRAHRRDDAYALFETALEELRTTGKRSHWIWYVFPQLAGLGRSGTSQLYGIRGAQEAAQYLRDPVLRERLLAVTRVVAERLQGGADLDVLMGKDIDAMKLVSSLTLFEHVASGVQAQDASGDCAELVRLAGQVLSAAAAQGYPRCSLTRSLLQP